jgi:hypothetical protein
MNIDDMLSAPRVCCAAASQTYAPPAMRLSPDKDADAIVPRFFAQRAARQRRHYAAVASLPF